MRPDRACEMGFRWLLTASVATGSPLGRDPSLTGVILRGDHPDAFEVIDLREQPTVADMDYVESYRTANIAVDSRGTPFGSGVVYCQDHSASSAWRPNVPFPGGGWHVHEIR